MPALALHGLTIAFLLVLFAFLFVVGRSLAGHLRGERARSETPTVAVIQSESQDGLVFRVNTPLVLGRSAEADVTLADPYASDFHARLVFQAGELRIQDLGSRNGTFVNAERMVAPLSLRRGDRIQIGQTIMEVR